MLSEKNGESVLRSERMARPSFLKPAKNAGKFSAAAAVTLTSLVDAFSILVIYLLVNMSPNEDILKIPEGQSIPQAANVDQLHRHVVIKLDGDKIFVDEIEVSERTLFGALNDLRVQTEGDPVPVILQADKSTAFEKINRMIQLSNQAGFDSIHFAVARN